ncbi:MAG: hypothetical protein F6K00_32780 [Leptolyngbya sp. SIOISBB]|nr:hypothetical protein [Leptolyngbya sp. SIOISBB]
MSVKKSMSIRLPESLADQLKNKASEEGVSVTEMINRFTRLGLRYTAEDRFSPFVGLSGSNGHSQSFDSASRHVQESGGDYHLSTQILMATETSDSEPDEQVALLAGFEKFIGTLESSMSYLTDDRNRECVVDTIGELAKLKTRLKLDPCFRKSVPG